jgi:hypothetical protein
MRTEHGHTVNDSLVCVVGPGESLSPSCTCIHHAVAFGPIEACSIRSRAGAVHVHSSFGLDLSIYSSLDVGLGGISSLSEAEPHITRLLALRSACSARSRTLSRLALSASARSSITLVNRRQNWHTNNGFPISEAPFLNFRHSKQITYSSPKMVIILPAVYLFVPGRGLIPQSTHHRFVALYPHFAFFLFTILSANFARGRSLRQS